MRQKKKEEKDTKGTSRIKEKLETCIKEREEYLEGWKRARADLINYKKEERKRLERFLKYSLEEVILDVLLPMLDDFERAEKSLSQKVREKEEVRGLFQIKKQLEKFLKKEGVEEIEVLGKKFDPRYAEVVEVVESDEEPDTVVEVVEKGCRLHNKVIRPAKVKVTKTTKDNQRQPKTTNNQ